jgi:Reverse transcriptase (RNA-dependent DNA polymerase)
VVLVRKLIYNFHSHQFAIVTAFLYGLLDEEIYMEFPEWYEKILKENHGKNISSKTHCVLVLQALYGLVQAVCQWYKKITSSFGKLDFHPSPVDPQAMNLLLISSYILMMELFMVHQRSLNK